MKKFVKCKWDKDVWGFYITPLIGISWTRGNFQFWIGWFYWLWTIEFNLNK